jgi:hypothetical protein
MHPKTKTWNINERLNKESMLRRSNIIINRVPKENERE